MWLDKRITLVLNKSWQVHDTTTPEDALSQMATDRMVALDIDGDSMNPVPWNQWLNLPVREGDIGVKTVRGAIRCPTVVVCTSFNKVILSTPKLSKKTIYERDGGTCQYTGRKVDFHEANLDHVIPASRGGKTSFDNLVLSHVKVNSKKDNRTPEEAGLKLLKKPTAPKPRPRSITVRNPYNIKDWEVFLAHQS